MADTATGDTEQPSSSSSSSEPSPGTDAGAQSTGQYTSPGDASAKWVQMLPPEAAEMWSRRAGERGGGVCGDDRKRKRTPMQQLELLASLQHDLQLVPEQRSVLGKMVSTLDADSSVVITNALHKDNPIVYVTRPWESMCGFSYSDALGKNPRITQGEGSDTSVMAGMSCALREKRACKVMMLNYKGGLADRPFWNMLSISPIHHQGRCIFYLANLQDYTFKMSKLVKLSPSQFCRSAEHHQRMSCVPSSAVDVRHFARPTIIETDELSLSPASAASSSALGPQFQMKLLGWNKLDVEPEHLVDRVVDALLSMEARYECVDKTDASDDIFVVNAEIDGVACAVVVTHDPANPSLARVSCKRLGGDTFAYHGVFRKFRELLGDAISGGTPLIAPARGGGSGLALMRPLAARSAAAAPPGPAACPTQC